MNLQNDYKVIYEKMTDDGTKVIYASKLDSAENIGGVDTAHDFIIGEYNKADFEGKVIYEHAGKLYVSTEHIPAFDETGMPLDEELVGNFDEVFVAATEETAVTEDVPVNEGTEQDTESGDNENEPEELEESETSDEVVEEPDSSEE